jgi:hypothetical protein
MSEHYISIAGLCGYMPIYCNVSFTVDDAVNDIVELHELGRTLKKRLRDEYFLDFDAICESMPGNQTWQERYGNEYAEIQECICLEPWIHQDSLSEEEFKKEYMKE